ncbi:MAG: hypothetical protein SGJ24_08175 [Chloroflexota bacterium]|nr:hypothetical protein [Chloroflexota bacterium]
MAQENTAVHDIDATIDALNGGLTALAPAAAVKNIESWHAQLEGSDDAGLKQVAADLAELKTLLTSSPLNGKSIGTCLTSLGKGTTSAGEGASGDVSTRLKALGALLTKAGGTLS